MPKAIEFVDAAVVHEFDDGWQLLDLRVKADLDAFGQAMRNCWTGTWENKLLPAQDDYDPAAEALDEARKRWDRPEYRKAYGDEWVESHVKADAERPGRRAYKLLALVDADGNLRAGSSLGLREHLSHLLYGTCDDLHQQSKSWVTLDGFDFCVLELRPCNESAVSYTAWSYNVTGESLDHFVEWYQGVCGGEWQDSRATDRLKSYA